MGLGKGGGMNTEEFMQLMRTGEHDNAFKNIHAPAKAVCRSACSRSGMLKEEDQAEVFQQTMLDLFRVAWKTFDGNCSLSTYLYGIAIRRCADFYRSKGRGLPDAPAPRASADGSTDEASEPDMDKEDLHRRKVSFEQRVCAQMAIQELERIDARAARALRAYVEEELSHEELARLLGVTLASLGNLVSRVRRELRRLCEEHCGSSDCTAVVTR